MSKIYGLFGSMTGKLGDTVMTVRNGVQIARKYQPVVYNPSTPKQIAQRAKLKLLSQLSAVMAPVIAIPRRGAVSSRNIFTKKNFPITTYEDNEAGITLTDIKLTESVVAMPNVTGARQTDNILVATAVTPGFNVSRVVYAAFAQMPDGTLRYFGSAVATEAGEANNWPGTLPLVDQPVLVLAYGVRDNTEAARVTFGDLTATTAENIAELLVSRALTEADVTLTETKGLIIAAA